MTSHPSSAVVIIESLFPDFSLMGRTEWSGQAEKDDHHTAQCALGVQRRSPKGESEQNKQSEEGKEKHSGSAKTLKPETSCTFSGGAKIA